MGWMTDLPVSDLSPLQADVRAEAISGPRGKMPAPMIAWLRRPGMARPAQALGAELRFGGALAPQLRELAILVCARHWTSHYEWTAHRRIALDAGLNQSVITAIARHDEPPQDGSDLALVWQLSRTILRDGVLDEASRTESLARLGEDGLVELVMVLGYYCLVALTLNVFELGLPEALAPELVDGDPLS